MTVVANIKQGYLKYCATYWNKQPLSPLIELYSDNTTTPPVIGL